MKLGNVSPCKIIFSIMAGGVCAVLNYDVDTMADYVSEMFTRLVANANKARPHPH